MSDPLRSEDAATAVLAQPLEAPAPRAFARSYLDRVTQLLSSIPEEAVAAFIEAMVDARDRGAQIFCLGNGGSATTASHFANDVSIGSRSWDRPYRAVSLADNVPALTAVANDYAYDEIFRAQLRVHMRSGDVVVAISASGDSENVVRAVEHANAGGATTVGITGFDGGRLRKDARIPVHVASERGEYGPTEDAHMAVGHLVATYLMHAVRREEGVR